MKNLSLFLVGGLLGGFLVGVISHHFFVRATVAVSLASDSAAPGVKPFRIAIMLPVSHPALEEIQQGFVETLNKSVVCTYDVYNANGDRTLLRSQAEEVVRKEYDLIFTIATQPALIVKEVVLQRGKNVPLVAGAVDYPVENGLVASMENSGNFVTAVTGCDNFEQQIDILNFLKPGIKKLLLVYNPAPLLEKQREQLNQACAVCGITLSVLPVFTVSEIPQKLPTVMNGVDGVIVLKDNLVVSAIESVISLCNRRGIFLYASDLNSADKGAALAYGVREYDDGVESAHKARAILCDHKQPSDVPSSATANFKCKIHGAALKAQGIGLDERLLFLLSKGEVI
jgi:putative ABC transport system substrate-binding protein